MARRSVPLEVKLTESGEMYGPNEAGALLDASANFLELSKKYKVDTLNSRTANYLNSDAIELGKVHSPTEDQMTLYQSTLGKLHSRMRHLGNDMILRARLGLDRDDTGRQPAVLLELAEKAAQYGFRTSYAWPAQKNREKARPALREVS